MTSSRQTVGRLIAGLSLSTLLILTMLLPSVAAMEQPDDYTCDDSGQLVCAGANVGANPSCSFVAAGTAQCEWTYGQLLGATSPLGLPGEATYETTGEVEVCLTDAALTPISCNLAVSTTTTGSCTWAPATMCVESFGPNPGQSETYALESGQCLVATVSVTAVMDALTVSQDLMLAQATHDVATTVADAVCLQNNGR